MSTEEFDLVVKFNGSNGQDGSNVELDNQVDEIEGIDEIQGVLNPKDPDLYIKESESLDVVLVELGTDSLEAAKLLSNSNPRVVSTVIPIMKVVKTDLKEIGSTLKDLATKKMQIGDNFTIETSVVSNINMKPDAIHEYVEYELQSIDMNFDEKDPKWKIFVEVVGENTGLNILKAEESDTVLSLKI